MKKVTAIIQRSENILMGSSNVIRWDDLADIQGVTIDIAKAVTLGLSHNLDIARKLERDLKSETGLLITFPLAYLMSNLQEILGSAEAVIEVTAP
jgi:hypothetical protein